MKLNVTFAASGLIFALSLIANAREVQVEEAPAVIRKVVQAVKPAGAPAAENICSRNNGFFQIQRAGAVIRCSLIRRPSTQCAVVRPGFQHDRLSGRIAR